MQIIQKMRKQRGSITLLGVGSIVLSLFAFTQVTEFANAKILDRELDNYARDVASVALRSELSLTKSMDEPVLDSVTGVTGPVLDRLTYTDTTVDLLLSNIGMSLPDPEGSDKAYNLEKRIIFGNIESNVFVPLTDSYSEAIAKNPKGSDDYIKFSAVAVQLWSKEKSFYNFTPQGKAIYGLPEVAANSTDIADCFCDKRYEMCLVSDMAGVPATFPGDVGGVSSITRQNYCEYGFVESHPGDINKTKYPSVELSSQWLAKEALEDGFKLIDLTDTGQKTNYDIVANQEPLEVFDGVNPFPTQTWSFWNFNWFDSGGDYYVRDWDGAILEKGDSYDNGYESTGDYLYHPSLVWPFPPIYEDKEIYVDGFFYVGRTGVCVDGTTATDVPNITGGLTDRINGPTNPADPEVQHCLSYEAELGSTTNLVPVTNCHWEGFTKICIDTFEDQPIVTNGYAQQSCRDFNSNVETRMNFFQWMMSLFFGPITNVDTSYKQLDCSVKKMQSFKISIFNWMPF